MTVDCLHSQDLSTIKTIESLSFEEDFLLGETDAILEAQFTTPHLIRTDRIGNIFVSDRGTNTVKVFKPGGEFSHEIGGSGRGPGEIQNLRGIAITNQDDLLVLDPSNWRATRYSVDGEVLAEYPVGLDYMIWAPNILPLDDDRFLTLEILDFIRGEDYEEDRFHTHMFHLFNEKFDEYEGSFGRIEELMTVDDRFIRRYANSHSGSMHLLDNQEIWYSPRIYDGRLFRFTENDGQWELSQTIRGQVVPEEIVTPSDVLPSGHAALDGAIGLNRFSANESGNFVRVESHGGRINSFSLGIFETDEGKLMHLSSQIVDRRRITLVEIFSQEGELEGVGQLEEFTTRLSRTTPEISSLWQDEDGRMYLIDRSGDIPVVRVGRIQGI